VPLQNNADYFRSLVGTQSKVRGDNFMERLLASQAAGSYNQPLEIRLKLLRGKARDATSVKLQLEMERLAKAGEIKWWCLLEGLVHVATKKNRNPKNRYPARSGL
jgi:hypothetical protein